MDIKTIKRLDFNPGTLEWIHNPKEIATHVALLSKDGKSIQLHVDDIGLIVKNGPQIVKELKGYE